MIFNTVSFLLFFFVLVSVLWFCKGLKSRMWVLLVASYIFYGWWDYRFLTLLFAVSYGAWWCGSRIDSSQNLHTKKRYLILSLILSLGVLAIFKYLGFFVDTFVHVFGVNDNFTLKIILPVGISFYVFQVVSYTIDIYRGHLKPEKSLPQFLLYVAFFPQLVAGPIVRAIDFLPQLKSYTPLTWNNFVIGSQLFVGGAIQKVLIADTLGVFVDSVFSDPMLYSTGTLWLAAFAFGGQIFGDFAGYSLMAIGIARVLGFELPENFRMPYVARSITEFWRRWHISLSTWLRDYLYIPLGGSRNGHFNTYINLFITMVLGGLWHGASWNFVLWGAMHGLGLALHKLWLSRVIFNRTSFLYALASWWATISFVCLLWIPFRADTFEVSVTFLIGMFTLQEGISWIHPHVVVVLAALALWHVLYLWRPTLVNVFPAAKVGKFGVAFTLALCVLCIFIFAPEVSSPFVYFQF